ncbi:MAG TPA: AsmA family protein, partial [Burkholderiales bacterium]|nr:AsmA family protein [Burkholderiales bacterium]
MKIAKYIGIAVAAIIVIVIAIGAYVAATFNPNDYKPKIIQLVKEKTGRTLKLGGDIKLSFWPNIGADLGKVWLSDKGSDKQFASVERARISLKLLPLLSKKLVVDEVDLKGLRADLVRFKDGKTNFSDLLGGGAVAAQGGGGKSGGGGSAAGGGTQPGFNIDIAHVGIEDAAVSYADQQTGAQYAVSDLNLKTGRLAPNVPTTIDFAAAVRSNKPQLNAKVKLKTKLTFDLEQQHYVLQELDGGIQGDAAGMKNLNATLAGDNVDAKLATHEFVIKKLGFDVTGKQQGGEVSAKFKIPQLTLTSKQVSGGNITLDATLANGSKKTAVKLDVPALSGNGSAFKADKIAMNIAMEGGTRTIKGTLTSPLSGNLEAQTIKLPKFVAAVNVSDSSMPKSPVAINLQGAASADLAKKNAAIDFTSKIDQSNVKGSAAVVKFSPPAYTFDVTIDKIDLDRYMAAAAKPAQGGAAATGGGGKPPATSGTAAEKPFDFSALKTLNANGSIAIGSLTASNIKASQVRLKLKAANGKIDVSPLSAELYQGKMNGALSLNAQSTPAMTVKQSLSGVNIGPLLKDLTGHDRLEGHGNVTLDVTSHGATASALKKALNGSAAVHLTNGAIKGINLAEVIRNAKAKLASFKGEQVQQNNETQKTDFSEFKASFNIKNGVAHNQDLDLKSPLIRVGGNGDVNLVNDTINYLAKASIVATTAGQGGKELADLRGITIPVRVTGALASPQYGIDFGALAKGAVEQKA